MPSFVTFSVSSLLYLAASSVYADPQACVPNAGDANILECTGDQSQGIAIYRPGGVDFFIAPLDTFTPYTVNVFNLLPAPNSAVQIDTQNKSGIALTGQGGTGRLPTINNPTTAFPEIPNPLTLNVGPSVNIRTSGTLAHGILLESYGGSGWPAPDSPALEPTGGAGGFSAPAGAITLNNCALDAQGSCLAAPVSSIETNGNSAYGILALSKGGRGRNGESVNGIGVVGGRGGQGGSGGAVTVSNTSTIRTTGDLAYGLYAESAGGNGGNGGTANFGLFYAEGGDGGAAGAGGDVIVGNSGDIRTFDALTTYIDVPVFTRLPIVGSVPTGETRQTLGPNGDGSHGIYARSRGGRGGNGQTAGGLVSAAGDGGGSAKAGQVILVNSGNISVAGKQSRAIFAESIGGGGGDAGTSVGLISIGGDANSGGDGGTVVVSNLGRLTTRSALLSTEGLAAMYGGVGLFAQSVGGGGGNGGDALAFGPVFSLAVGGDGGAGGNGGLVSVLSNRGKDILPGQFDIDTAGTYSHGIQAQSVGGGGGAGGGAVSIAVGVPKVPLSLSVAVGGAGGGGGNGGQVALNNLSTVRTRGASAYGILGQSVGGGGGDGGYSVAASISTVPNTPAVAVSVGGSGGEGGSGDTVGIINQAGITTEGQTSHGIVAQSVGGGGGNGGSAIAGTATFGSSAPVDLAVAVGGGGGGGGNSSLVTVSNSGDIITRSTPLAVSGLTGVFGCDIEEASCQAEDPFETVGSGSIGILAQSIGGGGGNGGYSFAGSFGLSKPGGTSVNASVAVGGKGGRGGSGGTLVGSIVNNAPLFTADGVDLNNSGNIDTYGRESHGIMAQSVGGGGGTGGSATAVGLGFGGIVDKAWNVNLAVAVGGAGGAGNLGGDVSVLNSGVITTREDDSRGILAQSIGGGGGNGGNSFTATIGLAAKSEGHTANGRVTVGGGGGFGNVGGLVSVTNQDRIDTSGDKSDGIYAQSVGGGGGIGGKASGFSLRLEDVPTGSPIKGVGKRDIKKPGSNWNVAVTVGGNGGAGDKSGEVYVDNSGAIITRGEMSRGILAQSVGGGGGTGGEGVNGTGVALVDLAVTALDDPGGANCSKLNGLKFGACWAKKKLMGQLRDWTFTLGGNGGVNGDGAYVEVKNSASIETLGVSSEAIFAQSIGGGGGLAQSFIKGSSTSQGEAGSAVGGATGKFSLGGAGGAAGNGGDVLVDNGGNLTTQEAESIGIFAQSVGGGGGVAGNVDRLLAADTEYKDVPILSSIPGDPNATIIPKLNIGLGVGLGQQGGGGGNGGDVTVINRGNITTQGDDAHGIFAQSIGGGGGKAGGLGNGDIPELLSFAGSVGGFGRAGQVVVNHNAGTIRTSGESAFGIFAQSAAGKELDPSQFGSEVVSLISDITVLNLEIQRLLPLEQIVDSASGPLPSELLILERDRKEARKDFLLGLDSGPDNIYRSEASAITINAVGNVLASGINAYGIFAQSLGGEGNGDITINVGGMVQGGSEAGVGVYFDAGELNLLTIAADTGVVMAGPGANALAILGKDGFETVANSGLVIGSVDLGGGINTFVNRASGQLYSEAAINLGAGNTLTNQGAISPGGAGRIVTTSVTGNLNQSATGSYITDVDMLNKQVDRINVSGTSVLDGDIQVNRLQSGLIPSGNTQLTILSSDNGVLDASGLELSAPVSAVVSYELLYPNANDVALSYTVDYAPFAVNDGVNRNRESIGVYINAVQDAGGAKGFGTFIENILILPDAASVGAVYDELIPDDFGNLSFETSNSSVAFNDAMHSCSQQQGDYRFLAEDECRWIRLDVGSRDQDETNDNPGYRLDTIALAGGAQHKIATDMHLGYGLSYENSNFDGPGTKSTGNQIEAGMILKRRYAATMVSGSASLGYAWYDTDRKITQPQRAEANSDQDIYFGSVHGRVSYDFDPRENLYIRPLVDLGVTQVNRKSFSESGAGAANLDVDRDDETFVTLQPAIEFGGEVQRPKGLLLRPYARFGVTQYLSDNKLKVTARLEGAPSSVAPFAVKTESDRTYGDVALGMDVLGSKGAVFRLEYVGQFGDDYDSHAAGIKFSMPFGG